MVLGCAASSHNRNEEEDAEREMDLGKKRGSITGRRTPRHHKRND